MSWKGPIRGPTATAQLKLCKKGRVEVFASCHPWPNGDGPIEASVNAVLDETRRQYHPWPNGDGPIEASSANIPRRT